MITGVLVGAAAVLIGAFAALVVRPARQERAAHNDRDYACRFWWGDRGGSAVGIDRERCKICNPA